MGSAFHASNLLNAVLSDTVHRRPWAADTGNCKADWALWFFPRYSLHHEMTMLYTLAQEKAKIQIYWMNAAFTCFMLLVTNWTVIQQEWLESRRLTVSSVGDSEE